MRRFWIPLIVLLFVGYYVLLGFYVPRVKEKAYKEGYEQGIALVLEQYAVMRSRWIGFVNTYGSIKNVPWDEFTLEEKMLLCAYGSPGNKLSDTDVQEVIEKYGGGDK